VSAFSKLKSKQTSRGVIDKSFNFFLVVSHHLANQSPVNPSEQSGVLFSASVGRGKFISFPVPQKKRKEPLMAG